MKRPITKKLTKKEIIEAAKVYLEAKKNSYPAKTSRKNNK